MKRSAFVALVAFIATIALQPAHAASKDPNAFRTYEEYFPSADGTMLHAWVYRPASLPARAKTPVILTNTPYNNDGGGVLDPPDPTSGPRPTDASLRETDGLVKGARPFEHGYTVVVVTMRGMGQSGGCYDFGGSLDQADAKAAIEWYASRPWSTGKVGTWGGSAMGWTQFMALANHKKPKGWVTAIIRAGLSGGYHSSYMNGVRIMGQGTFNGAGWALYDVIPPSPYSPPDEFEKWALDEAQSPACYATNSAYNYVNDPTDPFWTERDLAGKAAGTRLPIMMLQGFDDWNVRQTDTFPFWDTLRGPHRGLFGPWTHDIEGGVPVSRGWGVQVMQWYDHYLRGKRLPKRPNVQIEDVDGSWRGEESWPPSDAKPYDIPLLAGTYTDALGNNGETQNPNVEFGGAIQLVTGSPTGVGSWTFTQPLPYEIHMAGGPRLRATIDALVPNVNLVGLLYDVDRKHRATLVSRGAFLVESDGTVDFELYRHDYRFKKGHRIGVLISGADDSWFEPGKSFTPVTFKNAYLSLPALRYARTTHLKSGPFRPRESSELFTVDASTIKTRTLRTGLPPRMTSRR